MDEAEVLFKCLWCGWTGTDDEMDMNEHDEPTYCPECGHSSFDIHEMNLGDRQYVQVRIPVENARACIKGMAIYSDNIRKMKGE